MVELEKLTNEDMVILSKLNSGISALKLTEEQSSRLKNRELIVEMPGYGDSAKNDGKFYVATKYGVKCFDSLLKHLNDLLYSCSQQS